LFFDFIDGSVGGDGYIFGMAIYSEGDFILQLPVSCRSTKVQRKLAIE
jgi:hypothetical protein